MKKTYIVPEIKAVKLPKLCAGDWIQTSVTEDPTEKQQQEIDGSEW